MYIEESQLQAQKDASLWPMPPRINTLRYAALAILEWHATISTIKDPYTKLWLFNIMVTHALMYGLTIWAPSIPLYTWAQIENPVVLMLSQRICNKTSTTYKITGRSIITKSELHQLDSNHANPQSNNIASAVHVCKPSPKSFHHMHYDHGASVAFILVSIWITWVHWYL